MSREVYDWIGVRTGDIYQSPDGALFFADNYATLWIIDSMGQALLVEAEDDLFPAVRVAKNPVTRKVGKSWKNLTGDWACVPADIKTGDIYLSNVSTRLLWLDAWGTHWSIDEEGNAHATALTHPFPAQHLAGQVRDATAIKKPRRPKFSAGDKVQEANPTIPVFTVSRLDSEPAQPGEKHVYVVTDSSGKTYRFDEDDIVFPKGSS